MMITEDTILGIVASAVTEVLKYIPFLKKNKITRSLTAIILLIGGNFIYVGKFDWDTFLLSIVFALTSYKAVVQPIAEVTGMKTQDTIN